MSKRQDIQSVLYMEHIVFDKIYFKRLGISSDNDLEYQLKSSVAQNDKNRVCRVTLVLKGNKAEEYCFEISVTGFFSLRQSENLEKEVWDTLVKKNTIAILMPYLRSQVSLLTAQPGIECVVLPAFNINNLFEDKE